jgi:hypothetical protein
VQEQNPIPRLRFENELSQYCALNPSWQDEGYESEPDALAQDYGSDCDSILSEME